MAKVVRIIQRDRQMRVVKAAVREQTSPIEVVVERGVIEWNPIHGQRVADESLVELPRGFTLNRESLQALDQAV